MLDQLVLVDPADRPLGTMDKMEAHRRGLRHRAVSVLVFDSRGRMLLQQRAEHKYHSPGLWANTCCTHPHAQETPYSAACRRLQEEVGIKAIPAPCFTFNYLADLGNGLIEHEYDHVFTARYNGPVVPDPQEVQAVRWIQPDDLVHEIRRLPSSFAAWFRLIVEIGRLLPIRNRISTPRMVWEDNRASRDTEKHANTIRTAR